MKVLILWMCLWGGLLSLDAGASSEKLKRELVQRVRSTETLRVLFIGNSYSFKIPTQFLKIAQAEGKKVEVSQSTRGGWTLQKHSQSEKTLGVIAAGKWDVVVIQEQSQIPSLPEKVRTKQMTAAAQKLVSEIRKVRAVPVFFLTWGRQEGDRENVATFPNDTYTAMQKRLIRGYDLAAKEAGGVFVAPVGRVWSQVRLAADPGVNLYAKDGSHPSAQGNYLGGCVFFAAFYNEPVTQMLENPSSAQKLAKSAEQVLFHLQ